MRSLTASSARRNVERYLTHIMNRHMHTHDTNSLRGAAGLVGLVQDLQGSHLPASNVAHITHARAFLTGPLVAPQRMHVVIFLVLSAICAMRGSRLMLNDGPPC